MEEIRLAGITSLHADILETHILTRLDGPSLASLSCTSTTLNSLASQSHLWSHLLQSTWPSTATSPLLRHLIPDGGPRSFFSLCYSLPPSITTTSTNTFIIRTPSPIEQLISAVDIHFHNDNIFSKVQETETVSGWFKSSPFRIDLLDPKETITTRIPHVDDDDTCDNFLANMTLSWILIDPTRPSVMNMSSFSPVSATRHWLSKEVQVRFETVLESRNEMVQCEIVVTCGGSENGEMQVWEVSLEMEDMEGMHLNGKDSMVILESVINMNGKRKGKGREEEAKRKYREYVEKKKERREKKIKREGILDMLSIAFAAGSLVFAAFWFFLF
ncbi:putative F-box domain-containing protein [Heracleum sosnowskyi]|uniref:F-box domain-containing protein n=1 Tax=Heracleum sosnowskyi TaxID=360622 RepID=A0AAD8JL72_9APIA|nr:putative F-box domain-containing protein [Heracleum sosnowskyi]